MRPIADDQLLTLEHAAEIFLGDRKRVSTLRAEANRGNLVVSKIGRNYWTTLARLKEMDAKCRVEVEAPASGKTKPATPGQLLMADPDIAQGSALMTLRGLKKHFASTSQKGTSASRAKAR